MTPSSPKNNRPFPGRHLPRLLWQFMVRDFYTQISYRAGFLLSFVGIFFRAFTFFFISRLIGDSATGSLADYGGDYFSFVLLGIAFNSYFGTGLSAFAASLREAQTTGTLEATLMTPTPVSVVIIGSAVWNYAFTTFRVAVYIALGLWLGMDLSQANLPLAFAGLLLSILSFASIGIIAAAVIMIIKRGDPVTSIIASVSSLLGGIYYPIELLPTWLLPLSYLLPVTYALRFMRQTLLNGAEWTAVAGDFWVLVGFCVVLFPLSLVVFRWAVDRARTAGSLAQY